MSKMGGSADGILKHHFWIVLGVVFVLIAVSWYLGVSGQAKIQADQVNKINAGIKKARDVQGANRVHPNQESLAQVEERIESYRNVLQHYWQQKYLGQYEKFRWSESLEDNFVAIVEPLKNIELAIEYPVKEETPERLSRGLRNHYRENLEKHLSGLAKIVDSTWHVTGTVTATVDGLDAAEAGILGTETDEKSEVSLVLPPVSWSEENQTQLVQDHFAWAADQPPTTLEVLYAQESYWLLEGILNIIQNTNQTSDFSNLIPVKHIHVIEVGRHAAERKGAVGTITDGIYTAGETTSTRDTRGSGAGAMSGGEGSKGGAAGGPGMEAGRRGGGAGQEENAKESDPIFNRYFDTDFKPIDPDVFRKSLKDEFSKKKVFSKRVPLRLVVVIAEDRIPRFLQECQKSPLPFIVNQVRFNPEEHKEVRGLAELSPAVANRYLTVEFWGVLEMYLPMENAKDTVEEN
ncbi:MAG: hypothetical protein MPJ24_03300 [Pirellulaceae bacterium]|nr:hypothetical protein [Pirellulaceae bacterium]